MNTTTHVPTDESLKLLGRLAEAENEKDGLRSRNAELLAEVLNLNQRLQASSQEQLELRMQAQRAKRDVQRLDLEVRELKRRLREFEGGPPLSATEAAPSSWDERPSDDVAVEPGLAQEEPSPSVADLQEALRRAREEAKDRSGAARAALEALFSGHGSAATDAPEVEPASSPKIELASPKRKPAAPKKAAPKKAAPKKAAPKKAAPKKAAPKKAAPKKAAPKKAAPKKPAPQASSKTKVPSRSVAPKRKTPGNRPALKKIAAKKRPPRKPTKKRRDRR